MIKDGWTSGDETPPRLGFYWVNLEREPGATAVFFFSPETGGWTCDGSNGRLNQSERMRLFGLVAWWRRAECPPAPMYTPDQLARIQS